MNMTPQKVKHFSTYVITQGREMERENKTTITTKTRDA
jgi:hypothetical protein